MRVPELCIACRALGTRPLCAGGRPACWAEGWRVEADVQPAGRVPPGGGERRGCWPSKGPQGCLSFLRPCARREGPVSRGTGKRP